MPSPNKNGTNAENDAAKKTAPEKTMARINMDQEYPMESVKMIPPWIIYRKKIT